MFKSCDVKSHLSESKDRNFKSSITQMDLLGRVLIKCLKSQLIRGRSAIAVIYFLRGNRDTTGTIWHASCSTNGASSLTIGKWGKLSSSLPMILLSLESVIQNVID